MNTRLLFFSHSYIPTIWLSDQILKKPKNGPKTHQNGTFPVSINVVGLYNNIHNEDGLKAFEEALNKREDKTI